MGISFTSKGSYDDTERWLKSMQKLDNSSQLEKYGQEGVNALASATPVDTGLSASKWTYEILREGKTVSIIWSNTNVVNGTPVVILLQMGHGTRTGGYVQGRDFINPAMQPIFDRIASDVWKVVTSK